MRPGDLRADDLTIELGSSGSLTTGEVTCDVLNVRIPSSGKATMDGATGTTLDVELSSAGDLTIRGGSLTARTYDRLIGQSRRARRPHAGGDVQTVEQWLCHSPGRGIVGGPHLEQRERPLRGRPGARLGFIVVGRGQANQRLITRNPTPSLALMPDDRGEGTFHVLPSPVAKADCCRVRPCEGFWTLARVPGVA